MEKKIITISREFGSGGRTIGRQVAEKLGIPFYDKELVDQIAMESGFAPKFVEEHGEHSPGKSLFSYAFAPQGVPGVMNGLSTADFLWNIQCNVILQLAEKGPCVFIGRCADEALSERDDVLNIFIHASEDFRIARVRNYPEYIKQEQRDTRITDYMAKIDRQRQSYYNYYASGKWGRVETYDYTFDSSILGIDGTVHLITQLIDDFEAR